MTVERKPTESISRRRVVSDKMDKTLVVAIETYKRHSTYGKRIKYTKNLKPVMKITQQKLGTLLRLWKLVHCQNKRFRLS